MLRRFLALTSTFMVVAPLAVVPFACNETPRGDQGFDFYGEGGADGGQVPPDAHGPCAEDTDPTGICSQIGQGSLYTHLIVCTGGQKPAEIQCDSLGTVSADGSSTFCCTTGLP
jgi:hypothetical protein